MNVELNSDDLVLLDDLLKQHTFDVLDAMQKFHTQDDMVDEMTGLVSLLQLNKSLRAKLGLT